MFGFKKNKSDKPAAAPAAGSTSEKNSSETSDKTKSTLLGRLKSGLSRTRSGLTSGLSELVLGEKAIDNDVLDEIETLLLTSDVGVEATQEIVSDLTNRVNRNQLADADALFIA